jgi:hypothetical protein
MWTDNTSLYYRLDKDLVALLFRPDLIYCLRSVKYDLKSFIILLKPFYAI